MSQVRDVLSRLLLAAAEHLKALLRSSFTGQLQEEGGSCVGAGRSGCFPSLRATKGATNGHPASPAIVVLTSHALCKLSPLLSGGGTTQ